MREFYLMHKHEKPYILCIIYFVFLGDVKFQINSFQFIYTYLLEINCMLSINEHFNKLKWIDMELHTAVFLTPSDNFFSRFFAKMTTIPPGSMTKTHKSVYPCWFSNLNIHSIRIHIFLLSTGAISTQTNAKSVMKEKNTKHAISRKG